MKNVFYSLAVLFLFACGEDFEPGEPVIKKTEKPAVDTITGTTASVHKPDEEYVTYCNKRFGFCVNYPSSVLVPQHESANGAGCVFRNTAGEEVLKVWGKNNYDGYSLAQQFNDDLSGIKQGSKIIYKILRENSYVIAGYENGKIFYRKTYLADDAFIYGIMQYSAKEKESYNKIAEKIFSKFKQ